MSDRFAGSGGNPTRLTQGILLGLGALLLLNLVAAVATRSVVGHALETMNERHGVLRADEAVRKPVEARAQLRAGLETALATLSELHGLVEPGWEFEYPVVEALPSHREVELIKIEVLSVAGDTFRFRVDHLVREEPVDSLECTAEISEDGGIVVRKNTRP